jgi:galactokinase
VISSCGLRKAFRELYLTGEPRLFRAPGRVNLIGEHTDYNEGFVLPMAINRGTCVAAREHDGRTVRVHSINANETAEFDLDRPGPPRRGVWLDYVEGVAQALEKRGVKLCGADLLIESDVPVGAGLSSSAALEISVGIAILALAGTELDRLSLALAGQDAEHIYVGTKCGIMDQLVAACGRRGHALLTDCRSLETKQIPIHSSSATWIICDTGVRHKLAFSAYNVRREECEQAVKVLRELRPGIAALRDVTKEDLETYGAQLPEMIRRRCRHVVSENERTLAAAAALPRSDLDEMGRLMYKSHDSLRDDYEVSCRELDMLVDIARGIPGVFGARMTGGGFGGCTVNLVRRDAVDEFREVIVREYRRTTEVSPTIYVAEASDAAEEIKDQD